MKKYIKIFVLIVFCQLSVNCAYLDIDTPGIVNTKQMFSDERGFIDAMDGVYSSMTRTDLYGEALSFGFVDEIAQLYYNDVESYETTLNKIYSLKYLDEDVRSQIDAIWKSAYNVISSVNSVLDNAEGKNYPIIPRIKAEALAIRAFVHFDLLRLFGSNIEYPNRQAIPYVHHFSIKPVKIQTVQEVYNLIITDLEDAEKLINSGYDGGRNSTNLYINKIAIDLILARVYNWAKDYDKANEYAQRVIEQNISFNLKSEVKTMFMGYITKNECIWGLNAPKIYLNVRRVLMPKVLSENLNIVRPSYDALFKLSDFTASNNDYRYQAYFRKVSWKSGMTLFKKLYDNQYDEQQKVSENRVPGINMLRVSEAYYIMSESLYNKDKQQALYYLNQVITARGLDPISINNIETRDLFNKELADEIVKEYWGEGQIFMTYKHLGLPMKSLDGRLYPVTDKTYNLPIPESEKEYEI